MGHSSDWSDALAGEVLTDMAETFFGRRRELDEMVARLRGYAHGLREAEARVEQRAAWLHAALLQTAVCREFYDCIGRAGALAAFGAPRDAGRRPPPVGRSLLTGTAGTYTRLVMQRYQDLQGQVDRHLNGPPAAAVRPRPEAGEVGYRLVEAMCRYVNERIDALNETPPETTFAFIKQLQPEVLQKEALTGAVASDSARSWQQRYAFDPVRFKDLGLRAYPDLPPPGQVRRVIKAFCRKVCRDRRPQVKQVLKGLKAVRS